MTGFATKEKLRPYLDERVQPGYGSYADTLWKNGVHSLSQLAYGELKEVKVEDGGVATEI